MNSKAPLNSIFYTFIQKSQKATLLSVSALIFLGFAHPPQPILDQTQSDRPEVIQQNRDTNQLEPQSQNLKAVSDQAISSDSELMELFDKLLSRKKLPSQKKLPLPPTAEVEANDLKELRNRINLLETRVQFQEFRNNTVDVIIQRFQAFLDNPERDIEGLHDWVVVTDGREDSELRTLISQSNDILAENDFKLEKQMMAGRILPEWYQFEINNQSLHPDRKRYFNLHSQRMRYMWRFYIRNPSYPIDQLPPLLKHWVNEQIRFDSLPRKNIWTHRVHDTLIYYIRQYFVRRGGSQNDVEAYLENHSLDKR